jgi:hypothetical protein
VSALYGASICLHIVVTIDLGPKPTAPRGLAAEMIGRAETGS